MAIHKEEKRREEKRKVKKRKEGDVHPSFI
jgi:hypothetical protein